MSEQEHQEIDIDEQADLMEEEMGRVVDSERRGDLTPWLVPVLIAVGFFLVFVLVWLL